MSRSALALLAAILAFATHPVQAQEHYTLGPISRIILVNIKPGQGSEFWNDLRQRVRPLYDEYKRQGLIQNYSLGLKTTADGPEDWDVAIVLTFKNWAALDAFATKGDSVSRSYYGSYEKRSEAGAKRSEYGVINSSFLVRDLTLREASR